MSKSSTDLLELKATIEVIGEQVGFPKHRLKTLVEKKLKEYEAEEKKSAESAKEAAKSKKAKNEEKEAA